MAIQVFVDREVKSVDHYKSLWSYDKTLGEPRYNRRGDVVIFQRISRQLARQIVYTRMGKKVQRREYFRKYGASGSSPSTTLFVNYYPVSKNQ